MLYCLCSELHYSHESYRNNENPKFSVDSNAINYV